MEPNVLSTLPFVILLLSIAVIPQISNNWWSKYYYFVPAVCASATTVNYFFIGRTYDIVHSLEDYIKFISLLASLFIISGGILMEIKGYATPLRNVLLLAAGAVLSNIIGTTAASVLLIRSYIKSNQLRISPFHIVFFIFIVSNIGGSLTPIGDPPLLIGFIKGIPFWWIFGKVIIIWLGVIALLLSVFYVFDRINFKKQPDEIELIETKEGERVVLKGTYNFVFVGIVIATMFITMPPFFREAIMLLMGILSFILSPKEIHLRNHFKFHPINEVAVLFLGIFITMTPMLYMLSYHSKGVRFNGAGSYFWLTGLLSSLLDNAPAYLSALTAAMGLFNLNVNSPVEVGQFLHMHSEFITAISISAVFFGAMTYIGNAPNFMVKSIAAHMKVEVPGFAAYILKYSIPILLPLFVLVWILFI